ncbi:DUF1839 family protein [Ramlibacter sp. PS4R-6]|uniref:DUF1839 family protein n=1 Tax=Ramlibacter sp. PS4R-6 TaxID=3133438 RepID=UPI0030B5FD6D
MTRIQAIAGLDPARHQRHPLHSPDRDWPEKNCYIDLWIELLGAMKLEPHALLGHTIAVDFLGDQWTFFKPTPSELRELYGIDVQEMTVWRALEEHAVEHLSSGRLIATEADSFWLPDTEATDYRRKRTKTTIVIAELDTQSQRLGYFHNAGYFEAQGEDYVKLLKPGGCDMPLLAELVRIERSVRRPDGELAEIAMELLGHHFQFKPAANPFIAFAPRLAKELAQLHERGPAYYHEWAFASVRQAGAAFELAAAHLDWLARHGYDFDGAATGFRTLSSTCKSLILKGARVAHTGKPFDAKPAMDTAAQAWEEAMEAVESAATNAAWPGA